MKSLFPLVTVGALAILATLYASEGRSAETAAETSKPREFSSATDACTSSERWKYGPMVYSEWRDEMNATLSGRNLPVRGFAQALALRRLNYSSESKTLAEYWISRSLFAGKLAHIAQAGFAHIAARPIDPEISGIQFAALECLSQIHQRYPTLPIPASVTAHLADFVASARGERQRQIAFEAVGAHFRMQLAADLPRSELEPTLALLKGSGAHEQLAQTLSSARKSEYSAALRSAEKFLANPAQPRSLARYSDQVHALAARAAYSLGDYAKSELHLRQVKKSSNELARALSELAWSYLQAERYSEAIGTALNLQQGGLRKTFSPEAPMVMAMAMNEICQYPESVRAVGQFRKQYEKPYRWLESWLKQPESSRPALYNLAVQHVKLAQSRLPASKLPQNTVPEKIGSEWVRSPIFISHQDEINLMFDEKDASTQLQKTGSSEQRKSGNSIVSLVRELKPKIKAARADVGEGEPLPKSLRNRLATLRSHINDYRRLGRAAPAWRGLLANYQKQVPGTQARLIARINEDLAARSRMMLQQLEEIAENNQLIEVEIYNGASQDIIWQNAHPDYKAIAQKMKDEAQKQGGQVLDWGRAPASATDDGGEIWEDELGSFKANLYDNCSSKDKYLAIKRLRNAGV
jgi:tetratricopeptide (TPR) repeat protein